MEIDEYKNIIRKQEVNLDNAKRSVSAAITFLKKRNIPITEDEYNSVCRSELKKISELKFKEEILKEKRKSIPFFKQSEKKKFDKAILVMRAHSNEAQLLSLKKIYDYLEKKSHKKIQENTIMYVKTREQFLNEQIVV